MKVLRSCKNFILFGIALLLCFGASDTMKLTADAAGETGTVTVSYEVQGAEFRIYKIGTVNNGQITLAGEFANYGVDMSSDKAAQTLEAYVRRDGLTPVSKGDVDANKTLTFQNLTYGAYLVCGDAAEVGNVRYTPAPSLVSLPTKESGTLVADVTIQSKYEKEDISQTTDVSVVILWKDSGFEQLRPFKLNLLLLQDGTVVDKAELNEANNWSHKWENLDGKYQWTVVEENVADDYEVTIQKDGKTYIITKKKEGSQPTTPPVNPPTNTPVNPPAVEVPGNPTTNQPAITPPGQLPQTGQLWWPVYALVCMGLLFLIAGVVVKRRDCR